jgi:predicted DNA-binding ribbon-helix-helix protein
MQTITLNETYNKDLYLWGQEHIKLLKQGRLNELDIEHLIEEIEDMGKSEQRGISSHLRVLLMHLLKWEFQERFRGGSWLGSIRNSRLSIDDLIKTSPSLKNKPQNDLSEIYKQAREWASDETGLKLETFPEECPYNIEQVLNKSWLPGG